MKQTIFLIIILAFSIQAQNLKLEILNGHSGGGVLAVAVSSDGKFALTGSTDNTALLWDLETGKQLRRFVGHEAAVSAVQFSKDGKFVLTASHDKTARLWETATGKPIILQENRNGIFAGHEGRILSAAISADGKLIASGGEDQTARIWDARTGKQLFELKHAGRVNSIAFSPDSRFLLTGGEDKIARLFSTKTGGEIKKFGENSDSFSSVVYSAINADNFWHTSTLGEIKDKTSVAFSPDGSQILTGSYKNRTVRLWDVNLTKEIKSWKMQSSVLTVAFSPNGDSVIGGSESGRSVHLWDIKTGKEIWKIDKTAGSIAMTKDVKLLFVEANKYNRNVSVYDLKNNKQLQDLVGQSDVVNNLAVSSDSKSILVGADNKTSGLWRLEDGELNLWWRENGKIIESYKIYDKNESNQINVRNVAFSPNDEYFAATQEGFVYIHETITGKLFKEFLGFIDLRFTDFAFTQDGKSLFTALEFRREMSLIENRGDLRKKTVLLWDISTGEEKGQFGASDSTKAIVSTIDGKKFATVGNDDEVRLWNTERRQIEQVIKGFLTPVWSVAFSPDGKTIAAASGGEIGSEFRNEADVFAARKANSVRFFDVETGKEQEINRIDGFDKEYIDKVHGFKSVAYSPDGKFLATGSFNGKVYVKNNQTKQLAIFEGHTSAVNSVKFAKDADGKLLVVSGSSDSTTRIWDSATGEEICALITFRDGNWAVVQTRTGRYDAPNGGEIDGIQWVFGNETIALNQLKDIYYTPNLLPRLLGYMPNQPLADVRPLSEIKLFPEVIEQNFDEKTANLTFKIKNRGGGIGAVRLMINGSLAAEDARNEDLKKQLKTNPNLSEAVVIFNVKQSAGFNPKGENCIDIITSDFDQNAQKSFVNSNPKCLSNPKISSRGTAVFNLGGNNNLPEPTLYAIVAGVSDYNGDQLDLNYAAKDAEDFANALGIGARNFLCKSGVPQCDKVNIKLLTTPPKGETKNPLELPTKPNIKAAFAEFAQKAKPEDILVVYFAGHGTSLNVGEQETYFYLTQESENGSPSAVRNTPERSISNTEILDWLSQEFWRTDKKGIDAKNKVLILDTCAAGAFEKVLERNLSPDQIRALEKLKDRSGLQILMGSAANQSAYEASQYGQGLLTYALLEGMKGAALKNETSIETGTLFDYAVNRVPKMDISNGTSGLQSPRIFGSTSIPIGLILTKEDKDAIKIQESPLPIFGRPFFVKKGESDDTLFLIDTFAKKLDEAAETVSRGANGSRQTAPIVFIDKNNFPGALRVTGTYTEENGLIVIEEIKIKKGEISITIEGKVSGKTAEEVAENLLKEILKNLTKFTK